MEIKFARKKNYLSILASVKLKRRRRNKLIKNRTIHSDFILQLDLYTIHQLGCTFYKHCQFPILNERYMSVALATVSVELLTFYSGAVQ